VKRQLKKEESISLEPRPQNPIESLIRVERLPHMWCPGCGIGISMGAFTRAVVESGIDQNSLSVVSGIGCTGRVAGYLRLDSFHVTHGRAVPFATGLKLGNPKLKVVVYSGDGDLMAIGGNHLIHAARRNVPLTVILINNFNYGMTGGQFGPTTPMEAFGTTAPYGNYEYPFNLPYLMDVCGADYVARWTVYHVRQLTRSITEAMSKDGFSFIEVITPCPELYLRRNRLGDALKEMIYLKENSRIQNGAETRTVAIEKSRGEIIIGKFVDRERPGYIQSLDGHLQKVLGARYQRPPFWEK
jgi:2-oxoglutarate ferredoxin oxidoreductase subunit beta